ncbi:hypothetical protein P4241_26460 [Bacillus thuringiensis]|nr:hypothetical protein [Bacillus thuringiensis]
MKKLFTVFFALVLAFTVIGTTPAMAAGDGNAQVYYNNEFNITNYVFSKKPLLNSPSDPNPVGYVAWQYVTVEQAWFLIDTSLGPKWVGYNEDNGVLLWSRFDAAHAKLFISEHRVGLHNEPSDPRVVGYVANQHVTVKQAWYLINTSLGQKWIGYNM